MIANFIKVAYRTILRNPGYSFINIFGLAIGLACSILIILYIVDELSYDRYHENADRIVRVYTYAVLPSRSLNIATSSPATGPILHREFPQVENFTRVDLIGSTVMNYEDRYFEEKRFFMADSTFFNIFSHKFIRGNPETALMAPNSIVLTEATANKYFPDEDPVGKELTSNRNATYNVTAVIENVPANSHFIFDMMASVRSTNIDDNLMLGNLNYATYLLMHENVSLDVMIRDVPEIINNLIGEMLEQLNATFELRFQKLTDIYLYSDLEFELAQNGNINYIYIFAAVAFITMLIACINFMNLSTARSANRAKEVGLRKVSGAYKSQLIKQFLSESVFLAFVSLIVSFGLIKLLLPYFNDISGKTLDMGFLTEPVMIAGLLVLTVVVGFAAGSYPAFFLSSFNPVIVLKGSSKNGATNSAIRNVLVVSQFAVSVIFIIGSMIIFEQINYMRNKDLGFDKEQILTFRLRERQVSLQYETIKNELKKHSNVISAAASSHLPFGNFDTNAFLPEGKTIKDLMIYSRMIIDHDFVDTYRMQITGGRNFSRDFPTDTLEGIILNEMAVRDLGWETALNKKFDQLTNLEPLETTPGKVIGVVKDFHYESMNQAIKPMVLQMSGQSFSMISVRIKPENISETVDYIRGVWRKFSPSMPFDYVFVDDSFDQLFRFEERLKGIFTAFTAIAIFVSSLGLFGMASFTAQQRKKEIGIRKVLGSSVSQIVQMLIKDFTKLVVVGNVIGWILAFFIMSDWLQSFAYRINIGVFTFIVAGAISIFLAIATVSYQSLKAGLANPVNSIRAD
ncbi:ABC transporter permease [candidate division KSB1 bacterium]|nr:ABC transporter permease [candidate division KSB1 bacterium]